jgi:hypothetical protein
MTTFCFSALALITVRSFSISAATRALLALPTSLMRSASLVCSATRFCVSASTMSVLRSMRAAYVRYRNYIGPHLSTPRTFHLTIELLLNDLARYGVVDGDFRHMHAIVIEIVVETRENVVGLMHDVRLHDKVHLAVRLRHSGRALGIARRLYVVDICVAIVVVGARFACLAARFADLGTERHVLSE